MVSSTGATAMPPFSGRRQHLQVVFGVVQHLQHGGVLQQRPQRGHRGVERQLRRRGSAGAASMSPEAAGDGAAGRSRPGPGAVARQTPTSFALQRVQAVGLGVQRRPRPAARASAIQPSSASSVVTVS